MRNLTHFKKSILKKYVFKKCAFKKGLMALVCWTASLLLVTPAAHADIAVIVNPENPLSALNEDDVRRIFMGRMRLYPNSDQGIEAVDQAEAHSGFANFYKTIAGLTPAKLKRQRASYLFSGKGRLPQALNDDASVLDFVAKNPAAIGYVASENLDARVKQVLLLKQ